MLKRRRGVPNEDDVVEEKRVRFSEAEPQISELKQEKEEEADKSVFFCLIHYTDNLYDVTYQLYRALLEYYLISRGIKSRDLSWIRNAFQGKALIGQ